MSSKKSTHNTALVRQFLSTLAKGLDLEKAACEVGITAGEGEAILASILKGKGQAASANKPTPKSDAPMSECVIYVDGASRGNPGLAGAGAIIRNSDGEVIGELRRFLGMGTNNMAEYEALILALEEARSLGCNSVSVFADSELVVKQIKGIYKVKNEGLKGLYAIAAKLITQFSSFKIAHVKREFNGEADRLANEAIDLRDKD
jgi:ribonuclease HI